MLPAPDVQRLQHRILELLAIDSPTGDTADMTAHLRDLLSGYPVQVAETTRGNLIADLGAGAPRRSLAAHIDTLGAMVQRVLPSGRLELTPLGTWSARFAEGARVSIRTADGPIRGSILPTKSSGHAWNEAVDELPVGWGYVELRPDIRTFSEADTRAAGIQPGQIVTVDPQPEVTPNGFLSSRFLDNKVAVACALECLELMREHSLEPTVPACFLFTNAEEVGHGAGTSLPSTIQELVSVDIAPVAPNQHSSEFHATLGFKDASGPHDQQLLLELEALAERYSLPVVRDVFRHYHSDCSSILNAGYDTRTALLGFGTDSTHGYERTHMDSVVAVTQLMLAWLISE